MKEFRARKHLRKSFVTFASCFLFIFSLFIIYGLISDLTLSRSSRERFSEIYWSYTTIFISLIFVIFFMAYIVYFRGVKNIKVILEENNIRYICNNKEKVINYLDIKEVDFSHLKYARGWIRIKGNNTVIKITVAIEDISGFVKDFKEIMDKHGLQDKYDDKKMYDFYKSASYSDDSWERIYELMKFVPPVTGVDVVLGFIFSFFVYNIYIRLIMIGMLFAYPVLILVFSEFILLIKHKIELKNEQYVVRMRDYQYEHRVFDLSAIVLFIILATALIYFAVQY